MKNGLTQLSAALLRLHRDERGAEGLEKLLIILAVVIPLLGVLVWFRKELGTMLSGLWGDVQSDASYDSSTAP